MDFPQEIVSLLAQTPTLLLVMFIWWHSMQAHQRSVEYYRQRQQRIEEWMQKLVEQWSALDIEQKKIGAPLTMSKPVQQLRPTGT